MASNLNIVREETAPCRMKLGVEVPADLVGESFAAAEKRFSREAKIPGFRPGKAPKNLLRRQYGGKIREYVVDGLLHEYLPQAVEQEGLTPETGPVVEDEDNLRAEPGQPFVFAAEFDVAPEFELPDYRAIAIADEEVKVDEEQVGQMVDQVMQSRAYYEKVDRPAQAEDMLKCSYRAQLSAQELEEFPESAKFVLASEDGWVALREPEILPGVSTSLLGVEPGQSREIEVDFPDGFFESSLAGKSLRYRVEVAEVHGRIVPELTDEVAQELGGKSADHLKGMVRDNLQARQSQSKRDRQCREIVEALLDRVEFELPPETLARETYEILMQLFQEEVQKHSEEQAREKVEELQKEASTQAARRLKQSYVLRRIAEAEKVEVSADELNDVVAGLARQHRLEIKKMLERIRESGRLLDLVRDVRNQKALETLRRHLTGEESMDQKAAADQSAAAEEGDRENNQ